MTGAPSPPQYQPIAPYVPPNSSLMQNVENLPSPQSIIPAALTPAQVMGQASSQVEAGLPVGLQMGQYYGSPTGAPGSPGGYGPYSQPLMNQTQNWYMQNVVNPGVAQAQSQMQQGGQNYGTYGGAMAGQMQAEGQQQAFQAALTANQQQYQDFLAGRQAYFGQSVAVPQQQNAMDIQRGEAVYQDLLGQAGLQAQTGLAMSGQQNSYNVNTGEFQNQFNQNKFQEGLQAASFNNNLLGGIFGGGIAALGLGSDMFGGGGGGGGSSGGGGGGGFGGGLYTPLTSDANFGGLDSGSSMFPGGF